MASKLTHKEYVDRVKAINDSIVVIGIYNGYHNPIQHRCVCGNEIWYPQPSNVLRGGKCKLCAVSMNSKKQTKTHEEYVSEVYNLNSNIIVLETYKGARTKIRHQCECGNTEWYATPSNVLRGERCKICGIIRYAKTNTRSDEEFKQEVYKLVGDEYISLNKYELVTKPILMRHNLCRYEWNITPISFLIGTRCPKCANDRQESIVAITLKQVLKYYYKNTLWEYDIGFKGFNGGKSRYDIYVPELNLLIECQSEYHDNIEQQKLDLFKKNYAIEHGYDYMAIDNREYNALEAIQLFFPKINQVPKWVNISIRNSKTSWDLEKAQKLLDKGLTLPEIAEILNVPYGTLQSGVKRNLTKPKNYKTKQLKQRKKVVQLDLEGNFIHEYEGITLIEGFTPTNISACCRGKDKSYKGYRWIYSDEYYKSSNIPTYKNIVKQHSRPVVQISLENIFIKEYPHMSNIKGFNKSGIWNCCNKKKNTYKGFKWMYLEDYNEMIERKV